MQGAVPLKGHLGICLPLGDRGSGNERRHKHSGRWGVVQANRGQFHIIGRVNGDTHQATDSGRRSGLVEVDAGGRSIPGWGPLEHAGLGHSIDPIGPSVQVGNTDVRPQQRQAPHIQRDTCHALVAEDLQR